MVICDIDGVICDFVMGFRKHASGLLGRRLPMPDRRHYDVGKAFGLGEAEARRALASYYVSGDLAAAPRYEEWLIDHLTTLKECGVSVVLLTNRPSHMYPNLDMFTLQWVARNGVSHDVLAFTGNKGEYVDEKLAGANVLYAIEDAVPNVHAYAGRGILTFVPRRPYNAGLAHEMIEYVESQDDMTLRFKADLGL